MSLIHKVVPILAAVGDVVDLQNTGASVETTDEEDARARISVDRSGGRMGECWYDDNLDEFKQNDVVLPNASITKYQMKWEPDNGDEPNNFSVAKSTWSALSGSSFWVEWEETSSAPSERSGVITVSIRRGTGSVLDTALRDGTAVVEEGG